MWEVSREKYGAEDKAASNGNRSPLMGSSIYRHLTLKARHLMRKSDVGNTAARVLMITHTLDCWCYLKPELGAMGRVMPCLTVRSGTKNTTLSSTRQAARWHDSSLPLHGWAPVYGTIRLGHTVKMGNGGLRFPIWIPLLLLTKVAGPRTSGKSSTMEA